MEKVSPMVIDVPNQERTELEICNQKKILKRKRVDNIAFTSSPEEKLTKVHALRDEINSLVRFGKGLLVENKGALLENVEKFGNCTSLNGLVARGLEESDLPLSKLVDEIFHKIVDNVGNGDHITKASVKSNVLSIGQRLCYGVTNADADVLEDETESALWCWEARDLKLIPKSARLSLKVRRLCRKKIGERITAVLAMISVLEKSMDHQNCLPELIKASEKLAKVFCEADIQSLMEKMLQNNAGEMAETAVKSEEKLLNKQMEKKIKEMEKEKKEIEKEKKEMEKKQKKMDRELQREKLQNEKEIKRLHDEAEKEERRREREESEMQKNLKRQQEEAEKNQRRREKEEFELKKQLAVQKQASLMERFLKKNKANSTSVNDTSKTPIAGLSSNTIVEKSESVTIEMDSVLSQTCEIEEADVWKSHLNSWRLTGHSNSSNRRARWGIRQKPKIEMVKALKLTTHKELTCEEDSSLEKLVDGWVDSKMPEGLPLVNEDSPSAQRHIRVKKLLQFDKSHRPAFYGVWPRKSQVVRPCLPFAKDPEIDYEVDSDEEWEEDEPGESLSDCDKDEEDENLEGHLKGDDEDESEDEFFVPDGYLSENEGVADDMESDELVEDVRSLPSSEQQVQSEEFCTLLQQQKYLNNLTEHALRKNQPLIIMNLMNDKTPLLSEEGLSSLEKLERMCLQTLSIRTLPGLPDINITVPNDVLNEEQEASSNKSSASTPRAAAASLESELPQIISIIQSCSQSIGKIMESLHSKFPAFPKSQLRNKVREISEFSDNRWQVKKEILIKLGLPISPDNVREKSISIAAFFSKRCLPPSHKTMNMNETSPQTTRKPAPSLASQSQEDYSLT